MKIDERIQRLEQQQGRRIIPFYMRDGELIMVGTGERFSSLSAIHRMFAGVEVHVLTGNESHEELASIMPAYLIEAVTSKV